MAAIADLVRPARAMQAPMICASQSRTPRDPCARAQPEANMTVRRHVHHVHSGWPSPYIGVIAAILFGAAVLGVFSMLLWITR
ncbi:MAG TPA: hypothetical protein VF516_29585 [Kofleriaceae bacterium]